MVGVAQDQRKHGKKHKEKFAAFLEILIRTKNLSPENKMESVCLEGCIAEAPLETFILRR